jgi:hypothetical protein
MAEDMACAKAIPLMLTPTIVSTSSPTISSIMSQKIYETVSILSPLTAIDLHPTFTSRGFSSTS